MSSNTEVCHFHTFYDSSTYKNALGKFPAWKMKLVPTKSLERNSRFSVAYVKNKAEQNYLNIELGHMEKEKKTALRMLQNDKQWFKLKYSRSSAYSDIGIGNQNETLSKYYIPSDVSGEVLDSSIGDTSSKNILIDFQQIHNMLFTNDEIDIEKLLCLHLISAHRTESLTPARKKNAFMCKIHSPLERLLERSKRKNIHQEQKMTNMLPIYTIEVTEFGKKFEPIDLINDGRLAARILLNEKVRELINAVLNALKQSNPEKNYEIFDLANDISRLKKLFTKRNILDFLDDLMNCPLINSCASYILTAPFRVKSIQLEIRTKTGTVEFLVKQIRQNVLQLPPRASVKPDTNLGEEGDEKTKREPVNSRTLFQKRMSRRKSSEAETSKNIEELYSEKQPRRSSDPEKRLGRHVNTNFIQKNIQAAAQAKRVEYDTDEEDYVSRSRRSSQSSSRSRRSTDSGNISDRPNIQPIRLTEEVALIMEAKEEKEGETSTHEDENKEETNKEKDSQEGSRQNRRKSSTDSEQIRIHLKQTTCPACMERYKIPLPTPKTPRVKVTSVIPPQPGENPDLKTNSKNRLSMLINKEMFKLQSYEKRFSSDENSRRSSLKAKELETCSSGYLHLSPLELAKIEQEIREKETQKKLEKFLSD